MLFQMWRKILDKEVLFYKVEDKVIHPLKVKVAITQKPVNRYLTSVR